MNSNVLHSQSFALGVSPPGISCVACMQGLNENAMQANRGVAPCLT